MATYDLNRTELNGALDDHGVEAILRAKILSTLEEVGVYGKPPTADEARTSIVHDGEVASKKAEVVIYADDVSGYVDHIPDKASAIVFTSDDGVIADIGGSGHKIIVSGDGNDILTMTGSSSDEIYAGGGDDVVYAGKGQDTIHGGDGNDLLFGGKGNDLCDGGDDNDHVEGNRGDDSCTGGTGDDDILGLDGNDSIDGGDGNDDCHGGDC